MADPLSLSVSIFAILQASNTITGYLVDLKAASEEHKQLLNEVVNVHCLVNLLQVHAQQPETRGAVAEESKWKSGWLTTLELLGQAGDLFEEIRRALGKLETKLAPARGRQKVNNTLLCAIDLSVYNSTC